MRKSRIRLAAIIAIYLAFAAIIAFRWAAYAEGKMAVVASIFPLADIAREVGGEKVGVQTLLPSGASPHTFEQAPGKIRSLSEAKVFFMVGFGLEFWARKMVTSAANPSILVVDMSKAISAEEIIKEMEKGEEGHKDLSHKDISINTHFWLDPVLAKKMASVVSDTYQRLDPANKSYYAEREAKFQAGLDALHREISDRVARFKYKSFVSFHAAWSYFAKRYGLVQAGVIEEFPGKEPTPAKIAELVRIIKKSGARVVFAEPQFNPSIARALASEAGVKLLTLDPLGGEDIPDRSSYIKLMRYNLNAMERSLN